MARASFVQTDFTGGEWSKSAQGQSDDPKYKSAMALCYNGYPTEEKQWVRRPGFRHAAITRKGKPAKLIDFNFTERAPYNMEFTDGHLRLFSGHRLVHETNTAKVTAISTDTPAVVTVDVGIGLAAADQIEFEFGDDVSRLALSYLTNRQFEITPISGTTFSLADAITGAPIDGSLIGWGGTEAVTVHKVHDLVTPYTDELWKSVRSVQTDEFALLLTRSVTPQVLSATDPGGDDPAVFELNAAFFKDGPYRDPVPGSTATPDATAGLINLTLGFTAWSSTRAYPKGEFVTHNSIGYKSLQDVNLNNQPDNSPTYWESANPGDAIKKGGITPEDFGKLIRMHGNNATWTWGRIVGFAPTAAIDPNLAGTAHISGDPYGNGAFTTGAGLNAAFNGDTDEPYAECAAWSFGASASSRTAYIGQNYSGASAQKISSAIIYPPNNLFPGDKNQGYFTYTGEGGNPYAILQVKLRGKASSPSSPSDGTLLGQSVATSVNTIGKSPIIVQSNDVNTAWNYVWLEILLTNLSNNNGTVWAAEVQFFGPTSPSGSGLQVQILGDALVNTTTMTTWRLGLYGGTDGWPTCGCWHQGRLWLGGAVQNRFDGSKSNDPFNFEPTAANGTVADNNAIAYVFNSSEKNAIFWMEPEQQGIVCGTNGGEWLVQASANNNVLTPTSIQAHRVTKYGAANVLPKRTGMTTVFVHKFRMQLYEFLSDAFSGRYFGKSLSEKAKHLTIGRVEELAYQQELSPILWVRLVTNALRGVTYRRVSQSSSTSPEYTGWHQHELGSERQVESICVGPSVDGVIDALAVVTNDPTDGIRHVEIATNLFGEKSPITEAFFLDNAIVPSCGETVTIEGKQHIRFHGLWHLESKKVTVFAAGLDCGEYTVESGNVDVPYSTANAEFTYTWLHNVTTCGVDYGDLACPIDGGKLTIPCIVGFTYTSRGQLLRPATERDPDWGRTGAMNGPAFAKTRRADELGVLMHNAKGIAFGASFDKLRPAKFTTPGGKALGSQDLFSGVHNIPIDDGYSTESQLCWEVKRPYPASIQQIGGFLTLQDK